MESVRAGKQLGIPAQVEDVEKALQGLVVNPEDSIVDIARQVRVVIQRLLQLFGPIRDVVLAEVALPAQMRPRILDLKQAFRLELANIEDGIGVR